ncbi:unnamed protein product [Onchocerca flexuosa]|uniref:T-box domain-containing protein n=1 Tax=Onchocerca flexuosa TaxID=387005 RepID=A0A183HXL9_9BILA|nr:unnamed protein product [Onchocerca flexuosa]
MFPTLQVAVSGLEPATRYSLMVDLTCIDNKRYRYAFHQSKWIVAGPGKLPYLLNLILKLIGILVFPAFFNFQFI